MPPRTPKLVNMVAIKSAMGNKQTFKAFLSNKDNAAILLASPTARNAFVKELTAAGKTPAEINTLLGRLARITISSIDW